MNRSISLAALLLFAFCACSAAADDAASPFRLEKSNTEATLYHNNTPIYRYMIAWDPANHAETFKPFHHVYSPDGKTLLTKGSGGNFTHHRGLFWGWNTNHGDFWHGRNGVYQRHMKFLDDAAKFTADSATVASITDWFDKSGQAVARDTRHVTASKPAPGMTQLDFIITTESLTGDLSLGGDAQHAGFHFRAAQEVSDANNKKGGAAYLRPTGAQDKKNDVWSSTPWVAATFTVEGKPFTVIHMDHPSNPKPSVFSTRPYGRFGPFFTDANNKPFIVKQGAPLTVRYRILVLDGKAHSNPSESTIASLYNQYAKLD